jgi:hypothetical protein
MTYTCPHHNLELEDACPQCLEFLANPPAPDTMTGDERVAELLRWEGIVTVPFPLIHRRIEQLVGRPVWTNEMGSDGLLGLIAEARRARG